MKEMILAVAFAVLGFAVHIHIPIRASRDPLLNWGDARNLDQFLWHFLRKGYPVEKPVRDFNLFWQQVNAFNIPFEYTWVGLVLLVVGCLFFLRKFFHGVAAYIVGILSFLAVIVGYFNTPMDLIFLTEEFFTPLYLISAVFIGLGLFTTLRFILSVLPLLRRSQLQVTVIVACLLFSLPVTICALNYVENDQHLNYIANDYASNTLRTLPQGAVLYTWGDSGAFPLWYLQGVEKMREDLDLLHTPHLVFDWYLDAFPRVFSQSILRTLPLESMSPENILKVAISEQLRIRPVYIDFSTRYSVPFETYLLTQAGICYYLTYQDGGGTGIPEPEVWDLYSLRGMSGGMFFRDLDTGKAILIYANSHLETGESLIRFGRFDDARWHLSQAEQIAPEMKTQVSQVRASYGIQ